jgi:hypothetical protein
LGRSQLRRHADYLGTAHTLTYRPQLHSRCYTDRSCTHAAIPTAAALTLLYRPQLHSRCYTDRSCTHADAPTAQVRRHRTGNLGNLADAAIRQQAPQRGKFKKGKIEVRANDQLKPPLRPFLIQRVLKSNTPLDLAVYINKRKLNFGLRTKAVRRWTQPCSP